MSDSPATQMRTAIRTVLDAEFAPEGIVFASDKLHPAMGLNGPVGAVYPDSEVARDNRRIELVTTCYVQVFSKWQKEVDPAQAVDPTLVEGWAARVRDALKGNQSPNTGDSWYFFITQVDYIDDPTGNRSRFIVRVQGHGGNPNLVETGP